MAEIRRYVGVGKEAVFGTPVAEQFHLDVTAISLDSPDDPNLNYEGGIGRMQSIVVPGPYIPAGGVECAGDLSTLYYLMWILLGNKVTTDNTSSTGTETLGNPDANGDLNASFAETGPVVPGSIIIEQPSGTQVAHDDGFGRIVEDASSGVSGRVDYGAKTISMSGLTPVTAVITDYDYGTFEHIITPTDDVENLFATLRCGKDVFEHGFTSCGFNSLGLAVEREFLNVSLDVMAQKDFKDTLKTKAQLKFIPERPMAFHQVSFKWADYAATQNFINCQVKGLALDIANNSDYEGGLGIGSRFPCEGYQGNLEITGQLQLKFASTDVLEDFWGDSAGASDNPSVNKEATIVLDSPYGDAELAMPKMNLTAVNLQPSGRDRLIQTVSFRALYDQISDSIITGTFNVPTNFS